MIIPPHLSRPFFVMNKSARKNYTTNQRKSEATKLLFPCKISQSQNTSGHKENALPPLTEHFLMHLNIYLHYEPRFLQTQ
jgi:hypothetical protein